MVPVGKLETEAEADVVVVVVVEWEHLVLGNFQSAAAEMEQRSVASQNTVQNHLPSLANHQYLWQVLVPRDSAPSMPTLHPWRTR